MIWLLVRLFLWCLNWQAVEAIAACVAAFAATGALIATWYNLAYFRRYLQVTQQIQDATARQADAAVKQAGAAVEAVEREWKPDVRIASIDYYGGEVTVNVVNLARPAALITSFRIRLNEAIVSFPFSLPVAGGEDKQANIRRNLREFRQANGPPIPVPASRFQWEEVVELSFEYDSLSRKSESTPWFRCRVRFEDANPIAARQETSQ